jgi:hypothetical protein
VSNAWHRWEGSAEHTNHHEGEGTGISPRRKRLMKHLSSIAGDKMQMAVPSCLPARAGAQHVVNARLCAHTLMDGIQEPALAYKDSMGPLSPTTQFDDLPFTP